MNALMYARLYAALGAIIAEDNKDDVQVTKITIKFEGIDLNNNTNGFVEVILKPGSVEVTSSVR